MTVPNSSLQEFYLNASKLTEAAKVMKILADDEASNEYVKYMHENKSEME